VPAAAVTPALLVYIKVVAVKKLVVGFQCLKSAWAFFVRFFFPSFFYYHLDCKEKVIVQGGWRGYLVTKELPKPVSVLLES